MALKLTLGTGEELEIPFDAQSVITVTTVTTVDGAPVEKAEAHADVVAIELTVDEPEVPSEPVTMTPEEAAAIAAAQPVNPASDVGTGEEPTNVNPDSGVEPGTEQPVVEPVAHDEAVDAAHAAIEAAAAGGAELEHVQAAIADVNAALVLYPDSPDLVDAKFQLESIAGTTAGA